MVRDGVDAQDKITSITLRHIKKSGRNVPDRFLISFIILPAQINTSKDHAPS